MLITSEEGAPHNKGNDLITKNSGRISRSPEGPCDMHSNVLLEKHLGWLLPAPLLSMASKGDITGLFLERWVGAEWTCLQPLTLKSVLTSLFLGWWHVVGGQAGRQAGTP